ncbi:hypothetical protein AO391_25280 [Pseudomonas marginalis ICMP 9505]|nr:hypothetical protein AO391_25280 [Pseudomonas marginalis ICMP 9505]RMP62198.1 hypothetical protein ALQ18_02580 [Pseudomonas marginalis pv. marginalis]
MSKTLAPQRARQCDVQALAIRQQWVADMSTSMAQIEGLAANSEKIGSVLEVIRAIAEQTNLQ